MFCNIFKIIILLIAFWTLITEASFTVSKASNPCSGNGQLVGGECKCNEGFSGDVCEDCTGRFVLSEDSGTISNGPDVIHFSDCIAIIQPTNITNTSLYIQFEYVENSCKCDFLNVYDGNSVHDTLLATFNGDVLPKQLPMVVSSTGSVMLQFNNDGSPFLNKGYTIAYWLDDYPPTVHSDEGSGEDEGNTANCDDNWCTHVWLDLLKQGRASTSVQLVGDVMYAFGGYLFTEPSEQMNFLRLNTTSFEWNEVVVNDNSSKPSPRHDHSMVAWKDNLYVFGGTFSNNTNSNELWMFNTSISAWRTIIGNTTFDFDVPALKGHSAHSVTLTDGRNVMLVFFGYSVGWKVSPFVFEFDFDTAVWDVVETSGALPIPTYGHASVLDPHSNHIYLHGGLDGSIYYHLYMYSADTMQWTILPHSPSGRYLHSMVMLGRSLYLYGGKTSLQHCQSCSNAETLRYDIDCQEWDAVKDNTLASDRFGHSALALDNITMAIYGGYDGTMRNEVILFQAESLLEDCSSLNISECENSQHCKFNGHKCVGSCKTSNKERCENMCSAATSCSDCFSISCGCCMDGGGCSYTNGSCSTNSSSCMREEEICSQLTECPSCNDAGCSWSQLHCSIKDVNTTEAVCPTPCESLDNCLDCTSSSSQCYWCDTLSACTPVGTTNLYFPYGTCTQFSTDILHCKSDPCAGYQSCDNCFKDDRCGWCELSNNTGYGACWSGSTTAPTNSSLQCYNWHFTECPECQCNGHSTCSPFEPSTCTECTTGITGPTCGQCDKLYYGQPANGKNCTECECNDHADECSASGNCYCNVRGVSGFNCERCLAGTAYQGDAENETCFFQMNVMTQYSFSFSQSDVYTTKLNLACCPAWQSDITVHVQTSGGERINVTITTNATGSNETTIAFLPNITATALKMPQSLFHFGQSNMRCVRIYTSGIHAPTEVSVWIIQTTNSIGILVAIFLMCFGSLVLIAFILFKANQIVSRARRRREHEDALKSFAERAFCAINLDVFHINADPIKEVDVVCEEKCSDGHTSIFTCALLLPGGSSIPSKIGHQLVLGSCLGKSSEITLNPKSQTKICSLLDSAKSMVGGRHPRQIGGFDNPVLQLEIRE